MDAYASPNWSDNTTSTVWSGTITVGGGNVTSGSNYVWYEPYPSTPAPPDPPDPKPEAALEWLDRRVDEVRFRL